MIIHLIIFLFCVIHVTTLPLSQIHDSSDRCQIQDPASLPVPRKYSVLPPQPKFPDLCPSQDWMRSQKKAYHVTKENLSRLMAKDFVQKGVFDGSDATLATLKSVLDGAKLNDQKVTHKALFIF